MSAYLIIQATVHDWEKFKRYTDVVPGLVKQHGGKYIVMDGRPDYIEGQVQPASVVVSLWPDKQTAQDFWQSDAYQEAKVLREGTGEFNVILVEGTNIETGIPE